MLNGCFLPAPRPISVLRMCCATVYRRCAAAVLQSTPSTVSDPHPHPRKGLYPTLLSCFSQPARTAATSLLARLPKHSVVLTSRIHAHARTNTHTHTVVHVLSPQCCLCGIQSSDAQTSRPQSSCVRQPVICILSLAAT